MSEELIQRRLTKGGKKVGIYEYYNIGNTTIKDLRSYNIIPNLDYDSSVISKRPDGLLIHRKSKKSAEVICVIEHKQPRKFDTIEKQEKAIQQCIFDYCIPLRAKFGIVTDGTLFYWVIEDGTKKGFYVINREDDYPLQQRFDLSSPENIEDTIAIVERIIHEVTPKSPSLKSAALLNPSNLADSVWQTIWLASGENPDVCLATFVEIFIFKYLSDLGVLDKNSAGLGVSFRDNIEIDRTTCLNYYFNYIRPHIKKIFPPSNFDGTSIINGTVLDPNIDEHNLLFFTILKEFNQFGILTKIDPEFKSRLYENFLKKSISQKNWGQFFTPRNIVKAIIEMSNLNQLTSGAKVHDPACGVGGFLLEPLLNNRSKDFTYDSGNIKSRINYTGHDRDSKTIILAKANMLIYLDDLLKKKIKSPGEFAELLHTTFKSYHQSILGSLSDTKVNYYDLIMTNPPFVVTGTSKLKEFISEKSDLKSFYQINGIGVESLFIEKCIKSLKPKGQLLIVVPDGIMNRVAGKSLRKFMLDQCYLEAVVSLPLNAFYTTQKKTYILVLTKKEEPSDLQHDYVYSYLVTKTGETLDVYRFEDENDLPEMVKLFKYFRADRNGFDLENEKCKIWPIESFDPNKHWSIDRWWTHEELVELGVQDAQETTTISEFKELLLEEKSLLDEDIAYLNELQSKMPSAENTKIVSLGDEHYFLLSIGKRVLKKDLRLADGDIPVYSANVLEPWGFMNSSNRDNFTHNVVLWGIDGNWDFRVVYKETPFRTTDHCGAIEILVDDISPDFLFHQLNWQKTSYGMDRSLRASLKNMKELTVEIPIITSESDKVKFDLNLQREIADYYDKFNTVKRRIRERVNALTELEVEPFNK